jgi:hypothetical protein
MKLRAVLGGVILGALLIPGLAGADKKKPTPAPAITKLTWLAGRWRMERSGRVVDEQWMAPAGGVMLGMARTLAKGREVSHAFLQIREGPGGDLFYVVQTSGQKDAAYQSTVLGENAIAFENQQLDFPQKVTYILQPDGLLLVAFEGPGPDGQVKRVELSFQRHPP